MNHRWLQLGPAADNFTLQRGMQNHSCMASLTPTVYAMDAMTAAIIQWLQRFMIRNNNTTGSPLCYRRDHRFRWCHRRNWYHRLLTMDESFKCWTVCSVVIPQWTLSLNLTTPSSTRRRRIRDINWFLRVLIFTEDEMLHIQSLKAIPSPNSTRWSMMRNGGNGQNVERKEEELKNTKGGDDGNQFGAHRECDQCRIRDIHRSLCCLIPNEPIN